MEQIDQNENEAKNRFVVGAVGCGQAGTSAAQLFMQTIGGDMKHLVSINLSPADLKGATMVAEQNRILLDKNSYGAGGNRDVAKRFAIAKKEPIAHIVSSALEGTNINFVFFSTGGGTGSGIGPFFSALFESDAFPKTPGKPVPFFGVAMLPDASEGENKMNNTINALNEISKFSAAKAARFILVDNNTFVSVKDSESRWAQIDDEFVRMIKRYLFTSYVSSTSNLDLEDRYTSLCFPGVHSFCTFNPANPAEITSPFILPEGALVKRMACEIPTGASAAVSQLQSIIGCTVDEPSMAGYYNSDEAGAFPIVHFAGFSNLKKVTERYQSWLQQIKQRSSMQAKVDAEVGAGFALRDANNEYIEAQSGTDTSKTADDLVNLMNG